MPPPQHVVKWRDRCTPLLRHGAVSPNNVPENEKKKVRLLDMSCGHLASAS